jgi:hypothetical protein
MPHNKGPRLFPDNIRTIAFVAGGVRTIVVARIFFCDETAKAAVPGWACERVVSPEGIELKRNLFVDAHLFYNVEKQECLRILDWFPEVVDRGADFAREVFIPWRDVKEFAVQIVTKPL